ncbi:MAG: DUF4173 domain-containing protein [Bacteroidia bacterium]|nr:DUF4173 domain-containing protein [Bacteroidia bacterium]
MIQTTRSVIAPALVLIGYHTLFWHQWLGLNSLLFSLLTFSVLFIVRPESRTSRAVWVTTLGALIGAGMIVYYNTLNSKILGVLMYMTAIGFWLQPRLYFTGFALMTYLTEIFKEIPLSILGRLRGLLSKDRQTSSRKITFEYIFIPVLIIGIFFGIYIYANPEFSRIFTLMLNRAIEFLETLDWSWFLFMFTGIGISSVIFWQSPTRYWLMRQGRKQLALIRKRTKTYPNRLHTGLYHEFRIAILTLGGLNLLLLAVNLTDLYYVWLHFDRFRPSNFTLYVHEGTYNLVISILLAMGVALYFFRKNLNFFSKNQTLITVTYLWIAQNAFLAMSVGMRNFRYIEHFGLAYKRVGLILFLILTLFGLFSLYLKIKNKRSNFFLFVTNSWALFVVSILSVCINWDMVITRYNLTMPVKAQMDIHFLIFEMSLQNTPLLVKHQDLIAEKGKAVYGSPEEVKKLIRNKMNQYIEVVEKKQSWQSWNYTYLHHYQYLKQIQYETTADNLPLPSGRIQEKH